MENPERFLTQPTVEILKDKTKTLKEKRLAILNNTVEYYSENPQRRAAVYSPDHGDSKCWYRINDDQKACAIGRFLTNENYENLTTNDYLEHPISAILDSKNSALNLVPDYLKDLNQEEGNDYSSFLTQVQYLHDADQHWDTNGLSQRGLEQVEKIKKIFNLNDD